MCNILKSEAKVAIFGTRGVGVQTTPPNIQGGVQTPLSSYLKTEGLSMHPWALGAPKALPKEPKAKALHRPGGAPPGSGWAGREGAEGQAGRR